MSESALAVSIAKSKQYTPSIAYVSIALLSLSAGLFISAPGQSDIMPHGYKIPSMMTSSTTSAFLPSSFAMIFATFSLAAWNDGKDFVR